MIGPASAAAAMAHRSRPPTTVDLDELERQLRHEELQFRREKLEAEKAALAESNRRAPLNGDGELSEQPGEVYPDPVIAAATACPGVAPKQANKIFRNQFDPWDLIKLRSTKLDTAESLATSVEGGRLVVKRSAHTAKDYASIYVWADCFSNYAFLFAHLFGQEHPSAVAATYRYFNSVLRRAGTYEDSALINFAIRWHVNIIATGPFVPKNWSSIPDEWLAELLPPNTLCRSSPGAASKRGRAGTRSTKTDPNDESVSCVRFNQIKGCSWQGCNRKHSCSLCSSTAHGAATCPKK